MAWKSRIACQWHAGAWAARRGAGALGLGAAALAGPASAQEPVSAVARLLPQDLSPWGMFLNADLIVKTVMVGLVIASLITWTVWIAKTIELHAERLRARRALRQLLEQRRLDAEAHGKGAAAAMLAAAQFEREQSHGLDMDGVKERLAWQLERIETAMVRRMQRGTGILGTIGATAPFVGLFGTVWGIMNSFIGISKAQTTNLAVVAPGIAEALLATALGLVAAIPAVVIYNLLARNIAGYRSMLGDISAMIMQIVSRDGDRASAPLRRAAE